MEERLKLFLAMEGPSPSQFADKLGVQRSGISHLLSGRNKPSFEFISKMLLTFPKINPDWLINGSGKAYRDFATEASPAQELPTEDAQIEATESQVQLKESDDNHPEPELFGDSPAATHADAFKAKPADRQSQLAEKDITPSHCRQIAQITIFYTDGTYEVR